MRENGQSGEAPFRKPYIRAIIDRIEVDDHVIRIGGESQLEQAVNGRVVAGGGVRRCMPKWRSLAESNRSLHRERVAS